MNTMLTTPAVTLLPKRSPACNVRDVLIVTGPVAFGGSKELCLKITI